MSWYFAAVAECAVTCTMVWATVLVLLVGCGPKVMTQAVTVSSQPEGAQVLVDGKAACRTPCVVELARTKDHAISLRHPGYAPREVIVERQYRTREVLRRSADEATKAAKRGDVSNIWSAGMDKAEAMEQSGEAYVLEPDKINVTLQPMD